jgi:adenylyltransferase/sulfurtransferase
MGVLQALEAIKLLAGSGWSGGSGKGDDKEKPVVVGDLLARRMLLYDALAARFTTLTLRARRDDCVACGGRGGGGGKAATAAAAEGGGGGKLRLPGAVAATDYEAFTGQSANDALPPALKIIPDDERVTAAQLAERMRRASDASPSSPPAPPPLVLLDVRPRAQFDVMALDGAVNVPFAELDRRWEEVERLVLQGGAGEEGASAAPPRSVVVVVCRRGNHSQLTARRLRSALVEKGLATEEEARTRVRDLVGGYEAWAASCEGHVPVL